MSKSTKRFAYHLCGALVAALALGGCNNDLSPSADKKAVDSIAGVDATKEGDPKVTTPDPVTEVAGKHEQENCLPVLKDGVFAKGDCQEGLVCAPDSQDVSVGTCRVDCSHYEGDTIVKNAEKCPAGRSCQIAVSLDLKELGAFCLSKQTERDGECQAVGDADACSGNRICSASSLSQDEAGQVVASSFLCRETCAFGTSDANKGCPSGEGCVASPYDTKPQLDSAGKMVACQEANCQAGGSNCECNAAQGFACKAYIPGRVAICERPVGFCASMVTWAVAADFAGQGFSGQLCNEVSDHRFCDNSLLAGIPNGAQTSCVAFSSDDDRGFCMAICSAPALDADGDGKIGANEKGGKLTCPANFECSLDFGRDLGMIRTINDTTSPSGNKICDAAKCEAGKPCPGQCGPGDAECLTYPTKSGGKVSFCGAPLGSCQPKP
jgi:hypothetical protein